MRRDEALLLDMVMACERIVEFKQGLDRDAFAKDAKTQSAVMHQLMILGEAIKRTSPELRQQTPEINWSAIAGMRDLLIHHYEDVDLAIVWRTVERDVPELLAQLRRLAALS
jgi:uncharacterized protein with HEPN domain